MNVIYRALPHSFSILLLLTVLPRAGGQTLFEMKLPKKVEESPAYQDLLSEKEAQWTLIQREIRRALRAAPPAPLAADLKELALNALTGQETDFRDAFDRLREATPPPQWDAALILAAGQRIHAIDRQLHFYRPILKYNGDLMSRYLCDTALASVRAELAFYEIRAGDRIAEIGAGDERFAAALAASADSLTLFVNDIDSAALLPIAYHLQHNPLFRKPGATARAVVGTASSTGLENARLDRLIIRNAFHHFDDVPEMLLSIRQALHPRGMVYLKELYRENCGDDCCDRALSEAELKTLLKTGGFELAGEQILEDRENRRWRLLKVMPMGKLP